MLFLALFAMMSEYESHTRATYVTASGAGGWAAAESAGVMITIALRTAAVSTPTPTAATVRSRRRPDRMADKLRPAAPENQTPFVFL